MNWDEVDSHEMRDLYYKQNLYDALIAAQFGVTKREVTKKRRSFGISIKNQVIEELIFDYYNLTGKWPTEDLILGLGYIRPITKRKGVKI